MPKNKKRIEYSCGECGSRVAVSPGGEIVRVCGHSTASVQAHLAATVYSSGSLSSGGRPTPTSHQG